MHYTRNEPFNLKEKMLDIDLLFFFFFWLLSVRSQCLFFQSNAPPTKWCNYYYFYTWCLYCQPDRFANLLSGSVSETLAVWRYLFEAGAGLCVCLNELVLGRNCKSHANCSAAVHCPLTLAERLLCGVWGEQEIGINFMLPVCTRGVFLQCRSCSAT